VLLSRRESDLLLTIGTASMLKRDSIIPKSREDWCFEYKKIAVGDGKSLVKCLWNKTPEARVLFLGEIHGLTPNVHPYFDRTVFEGQRCAAKLGRPILRISSISENARVGESAVSRFRTRLSTKAVTSILTARPKQVNEDDLPWSERRYYL